MRIHKKTKRTATVEVDGIAYFVNRYGLCFPIINGERYWLGASYDTERKLMELLKRSGAFIDGYDRYDALYNFSLLTA